MELHVSVDRSVFFSALAYLPCRFDLTNDSGGVVVLSFGYDGDCANALAIFTRFGLGCLQSDRRMLSFELRS